MRRALDATGRKAAWIAGLGLLAMTVPVILANMTVFRQIMVPGDTAATVQNVILAGLAFRSGIFGMLFVIICDVVVAWALYTLLEPVNPKLSLLTAWFRVVYAAILGVAVSCLVILSTLLSNSEYLSIFESGLNNPHALLLFNAYYDVWGLGFILFGAHLLLLGVLALKSGYIPKLLGFLLILAGAGYIGIYTGKLLFPGFDVPVSVIRPGELVFMFWLLWAGRPAGWLRKAA